MCEKLILLLFFHWIGDFVLQNRWLAENKSKNIYILTLHVLVYTIVISCGAYLLKGWDISVVDFAVLNFGLHWITDYVTSRMNKLFWSNGQIGKFFISIGFDQFIHQVCIILSANLFLL